jgi:mono/diheme cytochrome c family protein
MPMRKLISSSAGLVAVLLLTACPGDSADQPGARQPAVQDPAPSAAAPAATTPTVTGELPAGVTPQMVSTGQQLYGTVCVACHGVAGSGSALGPAMNDQTWIHIGGEFEEIVQITAAGVARPQQYPAPMPPMGGGNFSQEQLRAIGAYVYALSRGQL